jgi:RecB family exonuclease
LATSSRGEVLVVAASHGAGLELVHRAAGSAALLGLRRTTLAALAGELAAPHLAASGRTVASRLTQRALVARACQRCRVDGRLSTLVGVAGAPGFVRVVAATLATLRAHGVGAAALGVLDARGRDLAALLGAYEEELSRRRLVDRAGLFAVATAASVGAEGLVGLPLLLLDLAPADPPEAALLRALVAAAGTPATAPATATVVATVDSADELARESLTAVLALDGVPPEVVTLPRGAGSRLDRLRRNLFLATPADAAEPPPTSPADDGTLALFAAAGESRECAEIARRLRALAASGWRFDDMAVLLRDPNLYLAPLTEALARAGIPAWVSRGTRRPDPAGRAFLTLLACADERLSASRFAEYLSFGQVPPLTAGAPPTPDPTRWQAPRQDEVASSTTPPSDGAQLLLFSLDVTLPPAVPEATTADGGLAGTLATPRHWERLLVDAAVVGGLERWQRRLAGLDEELALAHRDAEDDSGRERLADQRRRLVGLAGFALPLVADLAALPPSAPWGDWLRALGALAQRSLKTPDRVLAVLTELEAMAEVGPVDLAEVRRTLDDELGELRDEPSGGRQGKVLVASLDEVRGRSFRAVFVPGLAEGVFPRPRPEDPLLLDAEREQLSAARPAAERLPTRAARAGEERQRLRQAVAAAREQLVVSYPSLDVRHGRARVPSFYALDVLRAADGKLPSLAELAALATDATQLGWPAPSDPGAALDDAEYDLAVLAPLVNRDGATGTPGAAEAARLHSRARYLVDVDPRLGRALRARYARWLPRFSGADGLVAPTGEARLLLAGHRLDQRAYSPTALETYASCPYRFYLHGVLGLRERDAVEPLVQLDPLTRGSLFHAVQFALVGELAADGLAPLLAADLAAASALADAVLDRVAGEYRERLAPAIPRVWATEIEGLRLDLRGWLRRVAEANATEPWTPRHRELSFGLAAGFAGGGASHDPASRRQEVAIAGGSRLRGSIDLVEEHAATGRLRVTDHKTGRPPQERALQVAGGERLQPILYALAAEALLGRPVSHGRLFFCTRNGNYEVREVPLDGLARLAIADVLGTVEGAIETGFLPAWPRRDACRFCAFQAVCGPHEELRAKRKDASAMADLTALRGRH